jgi:uncharacterized RDD family membrane protein YckC
MSDSNQNPPPEGSNQPPPTGPAQPPGAGPMGQQPMGQPPIGEPGYGPATSGVGQPAGLLMRFLARFIDMLLVGIVSGIITAVLVGIFGLEGSGYGFSMATSYAANAVSAVVSAVLYLGYFTLLESRNGQTLGKMALKLQVQGPDGGTPTTEQALRRNAWTALGILGVVPILGIIGGLAQLAAVIAIAVTINSSPTRQGWHDKFAGGTKVIKIG